MRVVIGFEPSTDSCLEATRPKNGKKTNILYKLRYFPFSFVVLEVRLALVTATAHYFKIFFRYKTTH